MVDSRIDLKVGLGYKTSRICNIDTQGLVVCRTRPKSQLGNKNTCLGQRVRAFGDQQLEFGRGFGACFQNASALFTRVVMTLKVLPKARPYIGGL
jgi:hypothetical protein